MGNDIGVGVITGVNQIITSHGDKPGDVVRVRGKPMLCQCDNGCVSSQIPEVRHQRVIVRLSIDADGQGEENNREESVFFHGVWLGVTYRKNGVQK